MGNNAHATYSLIKTKQMKVVGDFNKISDKLKAEIPLLKPGQEMTFQLLHGVPNPDPDPTEKLKNPMLYGKRQLSTYFRIFDPYIKDAEGKETGGYVDVGAVKTWDKDQPETFVCFIPGFGKFQNTGKFSLMGGKSEDIELFEILWLSPQREGNPHADKTVQKMFKLINVAEATKSTLNKVDILRRALNLVANMKEEDARVVMASLNQKRYRNTDELMAALGELARNKPDSVLGAYDDPEKENKAALRSAFDDGLLEYNPITGDVKMDKGKLTNIPSSEDLLAVLNSWMKTADNGEQVLNLLKTKIKKAAKKEVALA